MGRRYRDVILFFQFWSNYSRDAVGMVGNVFIDPVYQVTHNTETDMLVGNDNLQEHNYYIL